MSPTKGRCSLYVYQRDTLKKRKRENEEVENETKGKARMRDKKEEFIGLQRNGWNKGASVITREQS